MESFNQWSEWLYSEGDPLLFASKLVVFIFVLEAASYLVALVAGITKAAVSK